MPARWRHLAMRLLLSLCRLACLLLDQLAPMGLSVLQTLPENLKNARYRTHRRGCGEGRWKTAGARKCSAPPAGPTSSNQGDGMLVVSIARLGTASLNQLRVVISYLAKVHHATCTLCSSTGVLAVIVCDCIRYAACCSARSAG